MMKKMVKMKYILKISYNTICEDDIIICNTLKDALHKLEYVYNNYNVNKVSLKRANKYISKGEICHV